MGKGVKGVRARFDRLVDRLPLRRAMMLYVALYVLLAVTLMAITTEICQQIKDEIIANAVVNYFGEPQWDQIKIYRAVMNASVYGEDAQGNVVVIGIMHADETAYRLCSIVQMAGFTVWPLVCLSLAAHRFYRRKLARPIAVLQDAAGRIGRSDLDFTIRYDLPDEMGRLCADFERMRAGVLAHERALWRMMEERRMQTAALSHDLRTPLTVLRGQAEQLARAENAQAVRRTAETMQSHILRMERYVSALNEVRRLEDAPVRRTETTLSALAGRLRETGGALCGPCAFSLETFGAEETILADAQLVERVFDNLVSNALRYAAGRVTAQLALCGERLTLSVRDDGRGFSEAALRHAAEPFWGEEKTGAQGHLGLGLNIVRTLCERCGGGLTLENHPGGGAVAAADLGPCKMTDPGRNMEKS